MEVIHEYVNITKNEKADWIISGPENEIILLSNNVERLSSVGLKVFHDGIDTLKTITNKYKLYLFFKDKIDVPITYTMDQYNGYFKENVIIKPNCGRGSSGVYIHKADKVAHVIELLNTDDYIIQQYIQGVEFTVDTLHDFEGNLLNVVPRRRIAVDSGISISAETSRDKKFYEILINISDMLKFSGANCFQFIVSDNKYYLTDINPRFGGGSILSIKSSSSLRGNMN